MSIAPLAHHGWVAALGLIPLLGFVLAVLLVRRGQLRQSARHHRELAKARQRGSHTARLQHPAIDLSQCIGCGACVRACPEDGVLALMHGQAVVVHGARCVGHGLCAAACPTGAISLTLGDLAKRRDLPALTPELEAVGVPGLYLAGELGGFALVRTAVAQGVAAADAVAQKVRGTKSPAREGVVDLLVVGAGPGGLACSLRAKERGLHFVTIEQETRLGGTVAGYPRSKMVMTQPVHLPLYGQLPRLSYQKEELVELWQSVVQENDLPLRLGVRLVDLTREADGVFTATTNEGVIRARNACLALGRRGSPRKLGVPGEDLAKVAYSLLDAESYKNRRVLIVGGGDSAVEGALALCEQPGNRVTISYRKSAFFRLKGRNENRINKAIAAGRVEVLFDSQVAAIFPERVRVELNGGEEIDLENDDVLIFAGGEAPFGLLEKAGVSFDPALNRIASKSAEPAGAGVLGPVALTFLCALVLLAFTFWFRGYYGVEPVLRRELPLYPLLRPTGPVGLTAGVMACAMFVWNLAYLVRRSTRVGRVLPGSLRRWMSWHVFTGLSSALFVLLHCGFTMRHTVGGHALIALGLVILSGSIGRYFYALVPRAANGTEASLENLRARLAGVSAEWDRDGRGFGERVRGHIDHLIDEARWRPGFFSRIAALVVGQFRLRSGLRQLSRTAKADGIPASEVRHVMAIARRAYRLTLLVTHYEEISAVLSSWRYFHRWLGLLLILLAAIHVGMSVRYGTIDLSWVGALARGGGK